MGPSTEGLAGASHSMSRCLTLETLGRIRQELPSLIIAVNELSLWLGSRKPQVLPGRCLIAAAWSRLLATMCGEVISSLELRSLPRPARVRVASDVRFVCHTRYKISDSGVASRWSAVSLAELHSRDRFCVELFLFLILRVAALGHTAPVAVPRLSTQLEQFVSATRAENLTAWSVGVTSFSVQSSTETFGICGEHAAFGIDALLAKWRSFGYTPRFIKVRSIPSFEKVARDFRFYPPSHHH